jgi:hypothetical protein
MQPDNNQPWTPKPYQPDAPQAGANEGQPQAAPAPALAPVSAPQQPSDRQNQDQPRPQSAQPFDSPQPQTTSSTGGEQEVQIWRHPEGSQPPIHAQPWHVPQPQEEPIQHEHTPGLFEPSVPSRPMQAPISPVAHNIPTGQPRPLEQSIPLDTSTVPAQPAPPQPMPWTPPAQSDNQAIQPAYGGKMAELPPLANNDSSQRILANGDGKKQRLILWGIIALLVLVPAIILGIWFMTARTNDAEKQQATQQQEKLSYNLEALQALGTNPALVDADVAKLNKTDTFYTVLKQAAQKQIVQTKWDVFYTAQKDEARGDKYTMYDTAIDYASKKYTYDENTYSNLGIFQTRCIDKKQYNFNATTLTTSPSWQPASDSTNCDLNVATMHLNDGLNTGGLTAEQADNFIRKIRGQGMLEVNNVSLAANKDKKYLKVDATITPKAQGKELYAGMQLLMNAFQATGLDADKHPYTYFGAGGEGATIQYYVDLNTQLPAYSVMTSTPAFDKSGKSQVSTSWSHRYIEYAFPDKLTEPTLDAHVPIKFTAWPDH